MWLIKSTVTIASLKYVSWTIGMTSFSTFIAWSDINFRPE